MNYPLDGKKDVHVPFSGILRRLAGWVIVGATILLVPASVYAWQRASAGEGDAGQPAQSDAMHKDAPATSTSDNSAAHTQLHVTAASDQPASSSQNNTSSHVSASVSGDTSATVTVNGRTATLSPNSSLDQTVSSNSNATSLNITMNSRSGQDVSGSSDVSIQVSNNSEGGQ